MPTRHTDYVYDALGRTTQATTYQGTGTGTPKLRTTTSYDAGGAPTDVVYSEYAGGSWPISDAFAYAYDLAGRMSDLTRTSDSPDSLLTHATYNADDTVATRTDVLGTAGSATFGYDRLGRLTSATSPLYTGSATYGWRLDGLPASRSWPASGGALTGAFAYDAAKRPISLSVTRTGSTIATFGRAYDRQGHVTSETQTLTGVTGAAGAGTQTFTYDAIGRITAATGLTGKERAYTYDASSNRLTETEGSGGIAVTTTYTYDRTEELKTRKVGADSTRTVSYDVFGNLTSLPVEAGGPTTTAFTYDLADHLLSLDGPTEPAVTFSIDALGRSRTRGVTGSSPETLFYLGTSDAVVRIGGGTTPVDAALDPTGVWLATSQASSPSFLLPDLHGNAAALWGESAAAFVDATRYDPYGETLDHYPAPPTIRTPWRFQGRMLEGEATDTESYDFGFRSYLADVAAFGSLDDLAGQATDVRSLNRFLYAQGDPVTLIDPDGHMAMAMDGGGYGAPPKPKGAGHHGGPHRPSGGSSRSSYNAGAAARMQRADAGGRRDPVQVTTPVRGDHYDWDAPPAAAAGTKGDGGGGFDLGGFVHGGLDVLGFVPVLGAVPDLINAGIYTAEGDYGNAALSATSAIPLAGDAIGAAKLVVKYGDDAIAVAGFVARHEDEGAEIAGAMFRRGDEFAEGGMRLLDDVGAACRHSFAATTPVVLADGTSLAIAEVDIGDQVQALDPDDGTTDSYEVTATFRHEDPVTGMVVVDGEPIATTPGHRFLTEERGWVEAQDLVPGDHVPSVSGGSGVVGSVDWTGGPRTMYDLTVAQVHTFAVGSGGWVVHNCGYSSFSAAKRELGSAGPGNHWDHVVEQSQIRRSGFAPEKVHSSENLRAVPAEMNLKKNGHYSSRPAFTNGKTVREWLSGQSFEEQFDYGVRYLRSQGADL